MTERSIYTKPTDAELNILQVLWRRGASTVREIHEEVCQQRPMAYTSVLKILQIMTEKGLVTRDESERAHIYLAHHPEEKARQTLYQELLERAKWLAQIFGNAPNKLVMSALSKENISAEEREEIRQWLDQQEGDVPK